MDRRHFITATASLAYLATAARRVDAEPTTLHVYGPGGPAPAMRAVAIDYEARTRTHVELVAGPTPQWKPRALADADVIFSGSENMMTDFTTQLPGLIAEATIEPAYVRPASILVHPGNPKKILGLRDLFTPGVRVMIVQGAGQTGMWEDLAGRGPHALSNVRALRKNIVTYAGNSAVALAAWTGPNPPDAWIIYNIWQIAHPDVAAVVPIEPEFALYRDAGIALTTRGLTNADAKKFYDFVLSADGARIFATWGWST
ncbi:MAG: AcfC family putative adhesin [Vulcanimicrobiaceae bacterium]